MKGIEQPLEERFWLFVEKSKTGCWYWLGSVNTKGYGHIKEQGKVLTAHRLSWKIHFGPIPEGMLVCHSCDVRRCVAPNHLFLGSDQDNIDDMIAKGRANHQRGEAAHKAKLTQEQANEIRRRHAEEQLSCRKLSEIYGIHFTNILRIIQGKTYKN